MKRYSVAEARASFADLLDAAERGEAAVIERRGVRFVLQPEAPSKPKARGRSVIAHVDRAVLDGAWTWSWAPDGVQFAPRQPRK